MASPSCPDPARDPTPVEHDAAPQSSEEPPIRSATASRATLVADSGDAVAFLDAPGLGAQELLDAVDCVLATMSVGAILTVFTDDPTALHVVEDWVSGRAVDLLAIIPHGDGTGTTLTFRRAAPGSESDAPDLTQS
jgi:TusA-related sulfurtransferase